MSSKNKTTATKKEARPALVPKLRFPEFRGTEGWSEEKLDDLVHFQDGFAFKSTDFVKASEGATQVIRITDINNKNTNEDKVYIPTTFLEHNKLGKYGVEDGDLLLSLTGAAGFNFFFWNGGPATINQRTAKVTSKRKAGHALLRLLEPLIHEKLNERGEGQNNNLSKEFLNTIVLLVPEPDEQQKIAECLSSVDELMAAQARKVDALKTHKKGLMQQLFPREGETQPRLRFPEFQNAGEWDSKPLGELGEIITGKTPSTKEADLWGGDILFITPTDISEDSKYQRTAARTVVETKSTKVLPEGSIIYTCIASIGKMALTVSPSITNQQINAVVPNKRALGEFLYYVLANLTPWIKTIPSTNTLPIINKTDFSKIAILHPGKAEQQRIASCLSSLDALITAETQKLEALKTHKKGLMQQLFPSPEEVEA